jgi:hypothetical protein
MKPFISAREFSRVVKRDAKTVIAWIERGWIPGARRVGNRYEIPAAEIMAYKNSPQYPPAKWQE